MQHTFPVTSSETSTPPGEPEKPEKPKGGSVKMFLSRKVNPKDSRSKKDGGHKEKKRG